MTDETATRRLRIVKYRGSAHGTNEFSFLIDERGVSVLPISPLSLHHDASSKRMSSGIARLDEMLGGTGVFRGSSVLVSGTAGTGKTSIAAHFVDAACRRGEKALYFAFEESPAQIVRNMASIGLDLDQWLEKGLLHIHSERPQNSGPEMHLVRMNREIEEFRPSVTVVDPITNLTSIGTYRSIPATDRGSPRRRSEGWGTGCCASAWRRRPARQARRSHSRHLSGPTSTSLVEGYGHRLQRALPGCATTSVVVSTFNLGHRAKGPGTFPLFVHNTSILERTGSRYR